MLLVQTVSNLQNCLWFNMPPSQQNNFRLVWHVSQCIYSYTLFKVYGTQLAAVLQTFKSCHKIESCRQNSLYAWLNPSPSRACCYPYNGQCWSLIREWTDIERRPLWCVLQLAPFHCWMPVLTLLVFSIVRQHYLLMCVALHGNGVLFTCVKAVPPYRLLSLIEVIKTVMRAKCVCTSACTPPAGGNIYNKHM